MRNKWLKRLAGLIVVAALVAAAVYALMPQPVAVDVAVVDRGPLAVTVDEEGMARIRDVFRVSAPIAGRLTRLPVHVGDHVRENTTEIAAIHPLDPSFLDVRTRSELEAAVDAAKAAANLADARLDGASAAARMAEADLERAQHLAKAGTISERALERAVTDVDSARAAVGQAKAELALRQSEQASAEARLIEPDKAVATAPSDGCCLSVWAPVSGTVLKLASESEQVIAAGTPLVEIGDPLDLEVVVHLLSSDAVSIAPGSSAIIDGWGGPPLAARVRSIDPAAYTKVSALGIEEQRVDATLDLSDPYDAWRGLGHGFRVMAHIPTWQNDSVVRLPLGALFRRGSDWNVYRVVDGAAVLTPVTIAHRNNHFAEVVDGLSAGDRVVLHPGDSVGNGTKVTERNG